MESLTGGKPYYHWMTDDEHVRLSEALHEFKGYAAVSGYECDLMDDLYGDWYKVKDIDKVARSTSTTRSEAKRTRQEVLWINEPPPTLLV